MKYGAPFLVAAFVMFAAPCNGGSSLDSRTAFLPSVDAARLIASNCYKAPPGITAYWDPTLKDLEGVEDTLRDYLKSQKFSATFDWRNYRRRVVGVRRGKSYLLFLSYSHEQDGDRGLDSEFWKRPDYVVFDGGDYFFRVLYDLKSRKFVWSEFNGSL